MRIALRDCEIVVINLASEAERLSVVGESLAQAGLEYRRIEAIRCNPGRVGCGLSHVKALRNWDGSRPFLVLEDDVGIRPPLVFDAPADADAIYLGTSSYGTVEARDDEVVPGAVLAEDVTPEFLRIHNMLASHAILHMTDRWRASAIEAMLSAMVDHDRAPDQGLANIQGRFRVFAAKRPLFFQRVDLQPAGFAKAEQQEAVTLEPLPLYGAGATASLVTSEGQIPIRVVRDGERLTWRAA